MNRVIQIILYACLAVSSAVYATAPSQVLTVNPSLPVSPTNFHKIQDAIDTFQGSNALYTEIDIAPGTYVETIQLEQTSASSNIQVRNSDLEESLPTYTFSRGLQINGDMRPCFPQYQNGYEHASNNQKTQVYILETSVSGVGPFPVLVSNTFGTQPLTDVGPLPVQVCNPFLANPLPITNNFAGGFAVVGRGGVGFATKASRVQAAGAGAMICVDNAPVGTVSMGGIDPSITIPCFSISSTFGGQLLTAITNNPNMTLTVKPPQTFYNPPTGTNYAMVTLSHPGGDLTKIQVTMTNPLPIVDPNLPRGQTPVLEQPAFDDPRLGFVQGDKIMLTESDIFGPGLVQVFEIDSLSGNIITLTTAVNPAQVDITKMGSSLTFLPNVKILPAVPQENAFRAQQIGFSMTGVWLDMNPQLPLGSIRYGLGFSDVVANLANIIVSDTSGRTANGYGMFFEKCSINILDGWRDSQRNRRLSVIGWSSGAWLVGKTQMRSSFLFCTGATNTNLLAAESGSSVALDSLILMGNQGLLQSGSAGITLSEGSEISISALLTVADIFGSGINCDNAKIGCPGFVLDRIYKPNGGLEQTNALQLNGGSQFLAFAPPLYTDGTPSSLIRTKSVVRDCFDIDPNADVTTAGTLPNVGIFVDTQSQFVSQKELQFENNSVDFLTVSDNQFITPAWSATPGSIWQHTSSGKVNPNYQLQDIVESHVCLTLDPQEVFQYTGVYVDDPIHAGKTFTIFSKNATKHCLKLTSGYFVGTDKKTLTFKAREGAYVTLKVLSPTEVLVLDSRGVKFCESGCKICSPCTANNRTPGAVKNHAKPIRRPVQGQLKKQKKPFIDRAKKRTVGLVGK
ncbi:MAG: hypothetical protein JSR37_06605 [Verrucomicrobia bacterium]|nr:hypothetical protein [Verrucomicrobiota bacterium]MBS0637581.1 hypothetical protein [Verrucomicrobiota bacterium]